MGDIVKHKDSGTFHEVDDLDSFMAAYPGQYEKAEGSVSEDKLGWGGNPEPGKWGDGTPAIDPAGDTFVEPNPDARPLDQTPLDEDAIPRTHAELDALAEQRGITFGDASTVAEKQAVLRGD